MELNYKFISEQSQMEGLLPALMQKNVWGVDSETEGLDAHMHKVVMLQIGRSDEQYVIDTRRVNIEPLRPFLESKDHRKITCNGKFDYKMLKGSFGIDTESIRDVMLAEMILHNGRRAFGFGLDDIVLRRLSLKLDKTDRMTFVKHGGLPFTTRQIEYGARDVAYLNPISSQQCSELREDGLEKTYVLECGAIPCFGDMEYAGFKLNVDKWRVLIEKNRAAAQVTARKMDEFARQFFPVNMFGEVQINYDSPKQILLLLQQMRVMIDEFSGDGTPVRILIPNTNDFTMKKVSEDYPILALLSEYRSFQKCVSTYGQSFIDAIHPRTGRIHAEYSQIGTETGRPASHKDSPFNPLNIPRGVEYREAFECEDDEIVDTADYSGCELRIWADASEDPSLMGAFERKEDPHCYAATKMYGVPVTKKNENAHLRQPAKAINFGIVYGMGPKRLFFKLNGEGFPITLDDTKGLYRTYCTEFKVGIDFLRAAGERALEQGYLDNMNGRRRYWIRPNEDDRQEFPMGRNDPRFQARLAGIKNEGGNFLIQSVNADMTKQAMIWIRDYIKRNRIRAQFMNQVYDEIVTTCHKEESEEFSAMKKRFMIEAAQLWLKKVPMDVDSHVGPCWTK